MASLETSNRVLVPPAYGQSWFQAAAGKYLPLTGGTMDGNIDMSGFKIVNLGQSNLTDDDAVTLQTVQSLLAASRSVPSCVLITSQQTTLNIPTGPTVATPLLPGIFESFILPTNWSWVNSGILEGGYQIGSNNVFGRPVSADLHLVIQLDFDQPTTSTVALRLSVKRLSDELVLQTTTVALTPSNPGFTEIILPTTISPGNIDAFNVTIVTLELIHTEPVNIQASQISALYFEFIY